MKKILFNLVHDVDAQLRLINKLFPIFITLSLVLVGSGAYTGLFDSPADLVQKDAMRIMYIHVPVAFLSTFGYGVMAVCSIIYLIYKKDIFSAIARAAAIAGIASAFVCLVTGSIWGKPMWGTWWIWDARLTSMLVLFFLYAGYIALQSNSPNIYETQKIPAILTLIGAINIPIIKFSVDWWNTLHQKSTLFNSKGASIDEQMLIPLLMMIFGMLCVFIVITLQRLKIELIEQKIYQLQLKLLQE